VVSHAVKQNLLKSTSGDGSHKITVIHNGIPDLFVPQNPLEKKNVKCVVTLIGRIKPEKGIWYFLEALSLLHNKQNLSVRIIGGPAPFGESYVEQLKNDILNLGMEIEYIQFTPDVRRFLNETDILVVPSTGKESFPTTVLEGMSAGKPVIATNTGGAAEAIVHEESGFLISNADPNTFAVILTRLIEDEHLRKKVFGQENAT
jgi:glycosyltransferase involved in cell wall biosynthesis